MPVISYEFAGCEFAGYEFTGYGLRVTRLVSSVDRDKRMKCDSEPKTPALETRNAQLATWQLATRQLATRQLATRQLATRQLANSQTRYSFLCFVAVLLLHSGLVAGQSPVEDATAAIKRGDYAAAERALARDPELSLLKGILQFHRGQYGAAQSTLEGVLEKGDDPNARTFLALSRAATGKCEIASRDLEAQLNENSNSDLRRLAGIALVQCHLSHNRVTEAFSLIGRLGALYPADADVLYLKARLHMKAWNEAVFQMFQKTPASFRVNQLSAEIFEIQGRYGEAASEYRKAIEKNPAGLNLHYRLGRALLLQSHAPEALAEAANQFEIELALNPSDAVAEYQIGQILIAQQKPAEAATRFERTLALSPEFTEALVALGKLRLDSKLYSDAIQLLERAVRLAPKSEAAHYNLMIAYRNAGDSDKALREKNELEKLQRPPEGEFTDFLKKLGERPPQQ